MSTRRTVTLIGVLVFSAWELCAQSPRVKDIMVGAKMSFSYGRGCDGRPFGVLRCTDVTEGGQTFLRIEYLGGGTAEWGAVSLTVGGDPRQPPRPSEDFSSYPAAQVEARGASGGERPLWTFKANEDGDDGREPRVPLERSAGRGLSPTWDLYTIPVDSRFDYLGVPARERLKKAYTLTQIVFGGTARQVVDLRLVAYGPARPELTRATNAASFTGSAVAPGQLGTLFGVAMGPADGVACGLDSQLRLPTTCSGTRVLFDDVPAPLFFVRRDQINLQVPYEVAGRANTRVQVLSGDQSSQELSVAVDLSAPGIFVLGEGRAAALNQDGSINSPQNRAPRGEIVTVFANGEGQTEPAGTTGRICAEPLSRPRLACSARIGGSPADILYCGCSPGFVGLLQVNVRVPQGANLGEVPVVLSVGNNSSQPGVNLSIR